MSHQPPSSGRVAIQRLCVTKSLRQHQRLAALFERLSRPSGEETFSLDISRHQKSIVSVHPLSSTTVVRKLFVDSLLSLDHRNCGDPRRFYHAQFRFFTPPAEQSQSPAAQGRYELPSCSATSPNFALRLAFSAQVLGPPRIASVSDALSASRAMSDKLSLEAKQTEAFLLSLSSWLAAT